MLAGSILHRLMRTRESAGSLTDSGFSALSAAKKPLPSATPNPLNFGVYYKNTLVALCHALEDAVLATDASPLIVTAFQKGKWYLQEADRYQDLAKTADRIVIMAAPEAGFREHPTGREPNVSLVDLDHDDPVAQEWHLMIMGSTYSAMVLCQELTDEEYGPNGPPDNDLERKFYGFWTFDPALVGETIAIAADHIGRYAPQLQADLTARLANVDAEAASKTQAVSDVVMRVVEYLQGGDGAAFQGNRKVAQTETFKLADALSQNLVSNELQAYLRMAQLADLADPTNPLAAAEVASLTEMIAQFLDLPVWQMQRLRLASLLHRIAPVQFEASELPAEPAHEGDSCPLHPGAQSLRLLPRLRAIAQIIAHQSESWDGSGKPGGLKGDSIPVESRILGLVARFQGEVARLRHAEKQQSDAQQPVNEQVANPSERLPTADNEWTHAAEAFATCQAEASERWDPKLVEILGFLSAGLQQGLSLPSIPLKMTLSTGLLNPEVADAWPTLAASEKAS
jgi:DICT domain-containing protein